MKKQMKYKVKFTAEYETVIEVADSADLEDAIADIDIPENASCKYVEDSFDPYEPEELND